MPNFSIYGAITAETKSELLKARKLLYTLSFIAAALPYCVN